MNRYLCAAMLLAAGTICTSTHAATGGPPRACCLTDGTCLNVTPDICEANGGVVYPEGVWCNSVECPLPPAPEACCLADGTCLDITFEECEANGGIAFGEGTSCASMDCTPPEPESCCDYGKPSLLVMQYTGEDCSASAHTQSADKVNCEGDPAFAPIVRILATDHEDLDRHNLRVWFDGDVALGDSFEIDSLNAGKPKLGAKTFLHIYDLNDELLQLVEFHSSCSQPLNTNDQFGSVILLECAAEADPPPGGCGDNGLCEDGKPRAVEMVYTGNDCSASSHSQSADKVNCEGDAMMTPIVRILSTDKDDPNASNARIWFDGEVALSTTFLIDAENAGETKLGARTYVYIYTLGGELLQSIEFHTSCSQPLFADDQFGGLGLVGLVLAEGGGGHGGGHGGGGHHGGGHHGGGHHGGGHHGGGHHGDRGLCNDGKPRALEMIYTGSDCSATSHTQDPDKVQCDGDAISMPVVRIVASSKEDPNAHGAKTWFNDEVIIGTSFFINAENAGDHKLKARTYVFVYDLNGDLLQFVEFHTSCSQPLFVDDQFGSLKVESMIIDTH